MDDEGLLYRVSKKDARALSELYDRYGRMIFSLAYHVLGDNSLAEEVTQDVFLVVWNKSATFDPQKSKFSTWIGRVTRNRAIDVYRRQNARPEVKSVDWDETFLNLESDSQVEPTIIAHQEQFQLRRALAELPEEQRKTLALAYFEGLTQQQISDLTGEPLGTVKTRMRLAVQKLRISLEGAQDGRQSK
jgi:RNA polymerase sigma-70 factor (ECF subfamily)